MNDLVERDVGGRFVKGQSGNPAGKTKGLRNFITVERLALEKALRLYVSKPQQAKKLLAGIDRVLTIAVKGEDKDAISAMKLMLDRVMPAMPPKMEEDAGDAVKRLQIIIVTNPDAKVPVQQVIEGECKPVEDS